MSDENVEVKPEIPAKDYTGLNRVLKAMRATDRENGDFNSGIIMLGEDDQPFIADLNDVYEAIGMLHNTSATLDPIMVAVHLWTIFNGGEIPLHPTSRLATLTVILEGDKFNYAAEFTSDEGKERITFNRDKMDIAQRMDITRRLSLITPRLAPIRSSWAIDYQFTLGENNIDFRPLVDNNDSESA
jgi:hypothetical protein